MKQEPLKKRTINLHASLAQLSNNAPFGGLSKRINQIAERYIVILRLLSINLTDNEKVLLNTAFNKNVLDGSSLLLHLRHMDKHIKCSNLEKNLDYQNLLHKIKSATLIERLAMFEASNL